MSSDLISFTFSSKVWKTIVTFSVKICCLDGPTSLPRIME